MKVKIIVTVAILMAVVTAVGASLKIGAEAVPLYISEIMTAADAEDKGGRDYLKANGYEIMENTLQRGSTGNAYIGFKTTTERKDAITDVRIMHANGGYQIKNYRQMALEWQENIGVLSTRMQTACKEMKKNLDAGSPLAAAGREWLNVLHYDGKPAGDYLLDASRTQEDYKDIILICNSGIVNIIYGALTLGVSDYGNDDFGKRFSAAKVYDTLTQTEKNEQDVKYWDLASDLVTQVRSFADNYQEGLFCLEDGADSIDLSLASEDEFEMMEHIGDNEAQSDEEEYDAASYVIYVGAYNKLNAYAVPAGVKCDAADKWEDYEGNTDEDYRGLGDYLVGINAMVAGDEEEIRYLYPLCEALTEGQQGMASINGFVTLAATLDANTAESKTAIEGKIAKLKTKISGLEDQTVVTNGMLSVFVGVDRDIYNQDIALTSEAVKAAESGARYKELAASSPVAEDCMKVIKMAGIIGLAALGVALVSMVITSFLAGMGGSVVAMICYALCAGTWLVGAAAIGTLVVSIIGTALLVGVIIIVAIIVICVIIWAIVNAVKKKNKTETPVDIPSIVVDMQKDNTGSTFVRYDTVKTTKGNPTNLNGSASAWDVLYYSKAEDAGSPLVVYNGKGFAVRTDSYNCPEHYMPVCCFEEVVAKNISTSSQCYLFFATEDSVNGKGGSVEEQGIYLYSLDMACNEYPEAALIELKNKGFIPIECNLTPTRDETTYIGYKTTNSVTDAIKDIRIAPNCTAASIQFGGASYTKACTTINDVTLYFSKYECSGSPIYADMNVYTSNEQAPRGWEPVNLFCGGGAVDLNMRQKSGEDWSIHRRLFFHPSTMYTDGPDYISGFAFFYGSELFDYGIAQFMDESGFEISPFGWTQVCTGCLQSEEYMAYSTTKNPKRAISDIVVYAPSQTASAVAESLNIAGTGYAACETYMQYEEPQYDRNWREFRTSNCYVTKTYSEGFYYKKTDKDWLKVYTDEHCYPDMRCRALFVAGPSSTASPLLVSDVEFSSKRFLEGYRVVHEAWDYYGEKAANIAQCWDRPDSDNEPKFFREFHYFYIHIKGNPPAHQQYVESVTVCSSKEDNYSDDYAIMELLAKGNGKIIKVNLNRDVGNQWYNEDNNGYVTTKKISGTSAYMLVTYTNTKAKALRDLRLYRLEADDDILARAQNLLTPPKLDDEIRIDGVKYNACGAIINSPTGNYRIYSSTNAVNGAPICDITVGNHGLGSEFYAAFDQNGNGHPNDAHLIQLWKHYSDDTRTMYYKNITFRWNYTPEEALDRVYASGCTRYFDLNLSPDGNGFGVIGYEPGYDENSSENLYDILIGTNVAYNDGQKVLVKRNSGTAEYTVCGDNMNSATRKYILARKVNGIKGGITNLQLIPDEKINMFTKNNYAYVIPLNTTKAQQFSAKAITLNDGSAFCLKFTTMKNGVSVKNDGTLASLFSGNGNMLIILIAALVLVAATVAAVIVTKKRKKGRNVDKIITGCFLLFVMLSSVVMLPSCGKAETENETTTAKSAASVSVTAAPDAWKDSFAKMPEETTTGFASYNEAYQSALTTELEILLRNTAKQGKILSACVADTNKDEIPTVLILCEKADGSRYYKYFNFVNKKLVKTEIPIDSTKQSELLFIEDSDRMALRYYEKTTGTQTVYNLDDIYFGETVTKTYGGPNDPKEAKKVFTASMDEALKGYCQKEEITTFSFDSICNTKDPVSYLEGQLKITVDQTKKN